MSDVMTPYNSKALAAPVEALLWGLPSNGDRLQPVHTLDRTVEALMIRLQDDQWISVSQVGSYRQLLTGLLDQAQSAALGFFLAPQPAKAIVAKATPAPRGSAEALLKLVERWLAEDDGYDADTWPVIQQDIEENRLSNRDRFHG